MNLEIMAKKTETGAVLCSFCSKSHERVKFVVSGADGYICNECVQICIENLEQKGLQFKTSSRKPEVDFGYLEIRPRFNKLKIPLKENHCFYLCPFMEPFDSIYRDHAIKALKEEGFSIERADEIFGTQPIIEDIWEGINSASIIVADVTGRNPNVMYEIGMAHTVGKPVVIIAQNMDDVPFDLKQYRCITYEYTPPGCQLLKDKLKSTVRFLKSKSS